MNVKNTVAADFNKPFARRLRALMDNVDNISPLKRTTTQAEIAEALTKAGIPTKRQTISLYINGKASPDMEKFKVVADFFGVSYDFLLGTSDSLKRENINISAQTGLTDKAIDTLSRFKELSAKMSEDKNSNSDFAINNTFDALLTVINELLSNSNLIYRFCNIVFGFAECLRRQTEIDKSKAIFKETPNPSEAMMRFQETKLSTYILYAFYNLSVDDWNRTFTDMEKSNRFEKLDLADRQKDFNETLACIIKDTLSQYKKGDDLRSLLQKVIYDTSMAF